MAAQGISLYTLENDFWNNHEKAPFSPYAIALYMYILHLFNMQRWPECIEKTDDYLAVNLHVARNTIRRARDELIGRNVITYTQGGNGKNRPSRYTLGAHVMNTNVNTNVNTNGEFTYNNKIKDNNTFNNGEGKSNYQSRLDQRRREVAEQREKSLQRVERINKEFLQRFHESGIA